MILRQTIPLILGLIIIAPCWILDGTADAGEGLCFWAVNDPKGTYGLVIVAVAGEHQLKDIIANDPAEKINKYEYFPMRVVLKIFP